MTASPQHDLGTSLWKNRAWVTSKRWRFFFSGTTLLWSIRTLGLMNDSFFLYKRWENLIKKSLPLWSKVSFLFFFPLFFKFLFVQFLDSKLSADHFLKHKKCRTNIRFVFQKMQSSDPSAIINTSNKTIKHQKY